MTLGKSFPYVISPNLRCFLCKLDEVRVDKPCFSQTLIFHTLKSNSFHQILPHGKTMSSEEVLSCQCKHQNFLVWNVIAINMMSGSLLFWPLISYLVPCVAMAKVHTLEELRC